MVLPKHSLIIKQPKQVCCSSHLKQGSLTEEGGSVQLTTLYLTSLVQLLFIMKIFFLQMYNTSQLNYEFNCTQTSPLVGIPWFMYCQLIEASYPILPLSVYRQFCLQFNLCHGLKRWRRDTQYNNIQHNDTQDNEIQHRNEQNVMLCSSSQY